MDSKNTNKKPIRPEIPYGKHGDLFYKDVFVSKGISFEKKYEIIWGSDKDKWPMDVREYYSYAKNIREVNNKAAQNFQEKEHKWLIKLTDEEWNDKDKRGKLAGDVLGYTKRNTEFHRQEAIKRYITAMKKMGKGIDTLIGPPYSDGKYYITHFNGYTLTALQKLSKEAEGELYIFEQQEKARKKKELDTAPVQIIGGKIIDPLKAKPIEKEKRGKGRPKKILSQFTSARDVRKASLYEEFYDKDPDEFRRGIFKDAMIGLRKNVIDRDAASIKIALAEFKDPPKVKTLHDMLRESDPDFILRTMLRSDVYGEDKVFNIFIEYFSERFDITPKLGGVDTNIGEANEELSPDPFDDVPIFEEGGFE